MDEREMKAIIESLLFVWGDPLSLKDIANVFEVDEKKIKPVIEKMIDEFEREGRGLKISQIGDKYQIGTRKCYFKWIKKLCVPQKKKSLSSAAIETLSIIAYNQPITKTEIEAIRGVRCDRAIKTLMDSHLVEEKGRLDQTGRPIIYGTTDTFLQHFGLKSLDELPPLDGIEEK